jgi:hypothetical protein
MYDMKDGNVNKQTKTSSIHQATAILVTASTNDGTCVAERMALAVCAFKPTNPLLSIIDQWQVVVLLCHPSDSRCTPLSE